MPATLAAPPRSGATATPARRLPSPIRERRPALAALGAVLVLGGALGSALVVHRSGDRVDVLTARHDLVPGERVDADDFAIARVAADGAAVIPASAQVNFVGTYATSRIPSGTLLNRMMFRSGNVVPAGAAVVGVVVGAAQRPAEALRVGDVVRAYGAGAAGVAEAGATAPGGQVLLSAARVMAAESTGTDTVSVSLLVDGDPGSPDTAGLVAAAAAGQVSLVRLADGTAPLVDLTVD